jgi:hypothetical protein
LTKKSFLVRFFFRRTNEIPLLRSNIWKCLDPLLWNFQLPQDFPWLWIVPNRGISLPNLPSWERLLPSSLLLPRLPPLQTATFPMVIPFPRWLPPNDLIKLGYKDPYILVQWGRIGPMVVGLPDKTLHMINIAWHRFTLKSYSFFILNSTSLTVLYFIY